MFVVDLLLLALSAVICPNPGVQRVFVHPEVARRLGNGLIRLHGQFHRAFLEGGGAFFRHRLAHRTHLVCCMMSLSPCVRKSIATSMSRAGRFRGRPRPCRGTAPASSVASTTVTAAGDAASRR